ncbi:MAG: acyl-CoA/acyl-ACP dehydrogenase [Hyphomicrobiales bacterium]|nr:acyl-CoA/acyl-ACP dehydrogenase [Hyphomicrobiales bacterium]
MDKTINLNRILEDLAPRFAADAEWLDVTDGFVGNNYDALREYKVFSALVPQAYGGGGATHAEMCEFVRGIAHACPSTALALSMHQHLVSAAVANDRAGRPGRPLLDKVAKTEVILVSTGANDWLDSNGSIERIEGGYRVTATKPFASGSPKGDVLVTSAAFDSPEHGPQVLHFPVPLKSEGVTFMDDWRTMGMRATGSQTVKLEGVFVPEAAVALRRPRGGFHPAFAVILTVALPLIMSAYVGVAEAAAEIARSRAASRSEDPVTQIQCGELEALLATAQMARSDMIRLANDFDFDPTVELASAVLTRKTICANQVIATAEKALEVAGGSGFFRKLGLERLLRDAHGAQFHPLPEKRQQVFTGRVSLGLEPVPVPALRQSLAA